MEKRGERFGPSEGDKAYLLSIDFPDGDFPESVTASNYQDVSIEVAATYEYEEEDEETGELISREEEKMLLSDHSFSVDPVASIAAGGANGGTITIDRSPAGSALLAGRKIYLAAEFIQDEVPDLQQTEAEMQYTEDGTEKTVIGTWISSDTAVFEIGRYIASESGRSVPGDIPTPLSCSFRISSLLTDANNQQIRWRLCTDTGLSSDWNLCGNLQSNVSSGVYIYTPEPAKQMTARTASDQKHILKASEILPDGETVAFVVDSNHPYKVRVEKQTALHTFEEVSNTTSAEQPATTGNAAASVIIPPTASMNTGTYRVCFSMDDFEAVNKNDNVYETFVVE